MKLFPLFILFFSFGSFFAQKNVFLTISHKSGDQALSYNQGYTNNFGFNYELTRVDYYVSSIKIIHDGGQVLALDNDTHILVRGSVNSVTDLGVFDVNQVEGITFSIGVHPSLNNADPSLQDPGAPLYFQSPSMHWGWSPGYFFVCLEGRCVSTFTINMQMHGLWNENYFEQTLAVQGVDGSNNDVYIHLDADYNKAMQSIDLQDCPITHGENREDLQVLENFRDHVFSAGNGALVNLESSALPTLELYPNPVAESLQISVKNLGSLSSELTILDVCGKVLKTIKLQDGLTSYSMNEFTSGIYFAQITRGGILVSNQKFLKQ